jgi:hypothetical protein
MPLPHDSIHVTESSESPEDPFVFFPSENQKPVRVGRAQRVYTLSRRLAVLTIAVLVRCFAVLMTASRRLVRFAVASGASAASSLRVWRPRWPFPAWHLPVWRLPTWRLPAWRLPALHLPKWQRPTWRLPRLQIPARREGAWRTRVASVKSQMRPVIRQIAVRRPSAITAGVFACGVVVGGSAMWLSGASRQAAVTSTASRTPHEVPGAAASPIAPVATAFANPPVVPIADPRTAAPTAAAGIRRPQFRGSLVVNSLPSGARVFVNGRSVGQTPLVLRNQPAGSRAIRVALDGYEPWSSAVQVVADTETRLRAELRAQRVAQP